MINYVVNSKKAKKIRVSTSDKVISILTYIIFGLFALICIYPFYYIFINSISANNLSANGKIIFLPHGVQFGNYNDVFKIPGLWQAVKISMERTVIGTILTVGASAFLGFMFSQRDMWLRRFWYRFTVVTMYFNAGIIPWYLTMKSLHLTNNFWGYILPVIISPFFIILVKTFIESVPPELQQAAEIDGAGLMVFFVKILLPVIKPILATIAIFAAVGQWNSFQDNLLLITNSKLNTLQYILYQYINQATSLTTMMNLQSSSTSSVMQSLASKQTPTSIRMTVTIVVVAPIILVYPIFQRFFVKGIMIGSVKG